VLEHLRKQYGTIGEGTELVLFNALSWTADDVEEQTRRDEAHQWSDWKGTIPAVWAAERIAALEKGK